MGRAVGSGPGPNASPTSLAASGLLLVGAFLLLVWFRPHEPIRCIVPLEGSELEIRARFERCLQEHPPVEPASAETQGQTWDTAGGACE